LQQLSNYQILYYLHTLARTVSLSANCYVTVLFFYLFLFTVIVELKITNGVTSVLLNRFLWPYLVIVMYTQSLFLSPSIQFSLLLLRTYTYFVSRARSRSAMFCRTIA